MIGNFFEGAKETLSPEEREKREELKAALKKLHEAAPGDLEKVKKGLAVYFAKAQPSELAMAEQELIREGTSRQEMKRLCDVHLEVMKKQLGAAKPLKLPASHPIAILKDEHKIIKRNLKKLARTLERLKAAGSFDKAQKQVAALKELSHFFLETEKHHQREEEAIFPELQAAGVTEPPQIFAEDHVAFKAKKKSLNDIAMSSGSQSFEEFLAAVSPLVAFLAKNLEDHIYKEDNILYPMSLKVVPAAAWKDIRRKFDLIGYCCFAPADLRQAGKKRKKASRNSKKNQR